METAAATAALEGRYAALLGCADRLSSDELLDVIEVAQREKDAASARQAVALAHLSARDSHVQFDINGNTLGGPPHGIDLDRTLELGTGPWDQILLDFPPRPPRPPQPIPF